MSCDDCGNDPVVVSMMDTQSFDTHALCPDCLSGFALSLALNTNPGLVDEDGRHKWVLILPVGLHDAAQEIHGQAVFSDPEASTPPAGPTPAGSSDGGSTDDAIDDECPTCGDMVTAADRQSHDAYCRPVPGADGDAAGT